MKEFLKASKKIGLDQALIQRAGGNSSIKVGRKMLVKASGFLMKDMKKGIGYVDLDYKKIKDYIFSLPKNFKVTLKDENNFSAFLGNASIEAGMHTILSKYVFHTHSVYANVFNCMKNGEQKLREIFGKKNILWIPYKNPGLALAHAIAQLAKKGSLPKIIFLQNHGLITHDDNLESAVELTHFVTRKIDLPLFSIENKIYKIIDHLFPDSIIFSKVLEINSASCYILKLIKKLGEKPNFISTKDIQFIQNMDKEKYRMKVNKFKNIKGILFDLDDTIYSVGPCIKTADRGVIDFLSKKLSKSEKVVSKAFYAARDQVRASLLGGGSMRSRLLYLQKCIEILLGRSDCELSLEAEDYFWKKYFLEMKVNLGVKAFFRAAKKFDFKIAVVTNFIASIQMKKIIKLDLAKDIDFLVTSEEAGSEKPNPIMFNLALEKLRLKPEQVVMVGDSYEMDILGARKLGIEGIYFLNGINKPIFDKKMITVKNFPELQKIICL